MSIFLVSLPLFCKYYFSFDSYEEYVLFLPFFDTMLLSIAVSQETFSEFSLCMGLGSRIYSSVAD